MPADAATVDEAVDALPKKKFSGKKLVLFILLPLLVIGGGGAGLYASGILDTLLGGEDGEAAEEQEVVEAEEPEIVPREPGYFMALPEILVNLTSGDRRQNFLKLVVSLELNAQDDVPTVERVMPRILDNFQVYLRELTLEELRGSAGLYRLREELLRRVNGAVAPIAVRDVLFQEMLVQ